VGAAATKKVRIEKRARLSEAKNHMMIESDQNLLQRDVSKI
jgi:hypothetical protein